jgi:hypothetical protein
MGQREWTAKEQVWHGWLGTIEVRKLASVDLRIAQCWDVNTVAICCHPAPPQKINSLLHFHLPAPQKSFFCLFPTSTPQSFPLTLYSLSTVFYSG